MNSILIELITTCEELLCVVGESFWKNKMKVILDRNLKNGGSVDFFLIDSVLSWYGGMASFNDLVISKHNDHLVDDLDELMLNNELDQLRRKIYHESMLLKQMHNSVN